MTRLRRTALLTVGLFLLTALAGIGILTQPFVRPIPSQGPKAEPQRLEAHVRHLSVDLHPRSYDQFDQTRRTVHYIADQFRANGAAVTLQPVMVEGIEYQNVIARFGPATGPLLVIGAHYDSHGDPASETDGSLSHHTPGADDNASGVAGLLELSRLLGTRPQTRAIELVAYALEEPPHFRTENMGSAWHARALRAQNREVELMLSLEMIGYFDDRPGSQSFPAAPMAYLYSDRGDFITVVGKLGDFGAIRNVKALMRGASDLPVHSINAPPMLPGIDFSDHMGYWNAGYPALMITDTAFMRNRNYHQLTDTYDRLDYRRMAKVVEGVHAVTQDRR